MTQVVRLTNTDGPSGLEIRDETVGEPGAGQLRIDMRAAGLNRSELMFMHGRYIVAPILPARIGVEGAGVISAVGPGVNGLQGGDAVCIFPGFDLTEYGVIAEQIILPADAVVPKPANLSFEEAAAVGMAYPSVYGGLVQCGRMQSSDVVVIVAASSGLGLAAVEFAKAHGATVIGTSRTLDKADAIKAAGADHVIATDEEDFVERVRELTGGQGFDLALDSLSGPFVEKLVEAAAHEARIIEFGALSMTPGSFGPYPVIAKGLSIIGFHVVYNLFDYPDRRETAMEYVMARVASGQFKPSIDRVFSLNETVAAYEYLAGNTQEGKVIIRLG